MRLLFDQNLSFRLVRLLADLYPESVHVRDMGLNEADDAEVWCYAAEHDLTIVSIGLAVKPKSPGGGGPL